MKMHQLKRKHGMTRPGPQPNEYLLGHSANEEERLRKQPQELAPDSKRLLDQLDIRPGDRAIDIGCGPQGILDLLSERVGARGRVVGLEQSESTVHLARQFIAENDLRNVEVLQGDANATGLPKASFDVVHARLVLVNVPDPRRVVEKMVDLARPGGVVASHEADWGRSFAIRRCLPGTDCRKFSKHTLGRTGLVCSWEERRTNCSAPPVSSTFRLTRLFKVYPPGHNRRNILRDFLENVKDRILAENLMTETEFHERLTELQRHLDDPGVLVISHLFLQVWGRKPGKTCVPERSA